MHRDELHLRNGGSGGNRDLVQYAVLQGHCHSTTHFSHIKDDYRNFGGNIWALPRAETPISEPFSRRVVLTEGSEIIGRLCGCNHESKRFYENCTNGCESTERLPTDRWEN